MNVFSYTQNLNLKLCIYAYICMHTHVAQMCVLTCVWVSVMELGIMRGKDEILQDVGSRESIEVHVTGKQIKICVFV